MSDRIPFARNDVPESVILRTVEEHLERVLSVTRQRPTVTIPIDEARGFALGIDARAHNPVPVFDNSAMDGFAVRYADVAEASEEHPIALQVVTDLPAGSAEDPALATGEAVRIMTGSPVPTTADTIVPFEDTVGGLTGSLDEAIVIRAPRAPGAHIRRAAEDAAADDVILAAGALLGPWQLSALASAGVSRVEVAPRPKVVIVSTGSELVVDGGALRRGQIPESNSLLIAGLVEGAGGEVVQRRVIDDEGDGPADAVAQARFLGADAVVFTGGVSAGAYEVVRQSLAGAMEFGSVALQPGKPQGFGVTDEGMLLFGLPGNPVGAAVSFEVFVRPALLRMQGRSSIHRPSLRLPAATGWRTPPGRRQYLPVVIDRADPAHARVRPATSGGSSSHLSVGLGVAEAYAIVPADVSHVTAGDIVEVMLL